MIIKTKNKPKHTNPAFTEELKEAIECIWNNQDNLTYSHLKVLKRFAEKK